METADALMPISVPERELRLRDGARLTLRGIRPDDYEREAAFVGGLSTKTGYRRLLSARRLTPEELKRFVEIDTAREIALVAVSGSGAAARQVGVGRCVRDGEGTDFEFAIVIADAWQGLGVGAALLRRLIEAADAAGVPRLVGFTLATNEPMLALARRLGFGLKRDPDDATLIRVVRRREGKAA